MLILHDESRIILPVTVSKEQSTAVPFITLELILKAREK